MHICILSYNHPDLTARVTKSILQFYQPQQVSLIHNGTERKWIDLHKLDFPEIQHVELQTNRGYSGGANVGLNKCFQQSDWVLFLTNDCQLVQPLEIWPSRPGIYCPAIFARKMDRMDSLGAAFDFRKAKLIHHKSAAEFNRPPRKGQFRYAPGTAYLIHKTAWETLKGFDESYGTYWEDVEFSYRAHHLGIPISLEPRIQILHGVGKTCHKHSHYTLYLYQRNRSRFFHQYSKENTLSFRDHWQGRLSLLWDQVRIFKNLLSRRRWSDVGLFAKALKHARDQGKLHSQAQFQARILEYETAPSTRA